LPGTQRGDYRIAMWRVNARLDIWDGHGNRDVVKRRIMSSLCRDGAVDARVLLMALAQFPKGRISTRMTTIHIHAAEHSHQ